MAVGPPFSADQLRWRAAELANRRRRLEFETDQFHEYIAALDIPGLQDAGFSAADATAFKQRADVHGTMPAVYFGRAGQADPYDFDNALADVRGPGSG